MTLPATARRAGPFAGNDSATEFPFEFKVFATSEIAVILSDGTTETTLTLGGDYSVTLNSDQNADPGGTITYPLTGDPLADGETLAVIGALPYNQTTSISGGGNFRPEVHQTAFERNVMQTQQLAELCGRTIRAAASDDAPLMALPVAAERANGLPAFDSNGDLNVQPLFNILSEIGVEVYDDGAWGGAFAADDALWG